LVVGVPVRGSPKWVYWMNNGRRVVLVVLASVPETLSHLLCECTR